MLLACLTYGFADNLAKLRSFRKFDGEPICGNINVIEIVDYWGAVIVSTQKYF